MNNIITFYDAVHDDSEPPEPIIDEGVLLDKTILMIIGELVSKILTRLVKVLRRYIF